MSHTAIAAALACEELSAGERLAAFSLTSFANREQLAWPGTPAAAARAGLSRSRFLEARDGLVRRGLIDVIDAARGGRGHASVLWLRFAHDGPWWDAEINAELFEATLSCSGARGPARLLLAAIAALADEHAVLADVTTAELCQAAGIANSTYRRARAALLGSGAVALVNGRGGRGNANRWKVAVPASADLARPARRRVAPPIDARPLVAAVPEAINTAHDRTVSERDRPTLTGVSEPKGAQARTVSEQNRPTLSGVSELKGALARTVSITRAVERAPQTPPETPPPNARAGREPQNPGTPEDPPAPLAGGRDTDSILIDETYLTDRGRRRRRTVRVDLAEVRRQLRTPALADHADWQRIRALLTEAVGESTFAIWLEPLELIAIDNASGALVFAAPEATVGWLRERFGRLITSCGQRVGRELRTAEEVERRALDHDKTCPDAIARAFATN